MDAFDQRTIYDRTQSDRNFAELKDLILGRNSYAATAATVPTSNLDSDHDRSALDISLLSPIVGRTGRSSSPFDDANVTRRTSSGANLGRQNPVREEDEHEDMPGLHYDDDEVDNAEDDPEGRDGDTVSDTSLASNVAARRTIHDIRQDITDKVDQMRRLLPSNKTAISTLQRTINKSRFALLDYYQQLHDRHDQTAPVEAPDPGLNTQDTKESHGASTTTQDARESRGAATTAPTHDRHGNPLSARGRPITPWHRAKDPIQRTSATNPGDGDGGDDDPDDPHGGGDDDRRRQPNNRWFTPRPPSRSSTMVPDVYEENLMRRRILSVSKYYRPDNHANKVAWLSNSIDGPYAGKPDRLTKGTFTLNDDTTSSFFIFYNALRTLLTTCGYNVELLPTMATVRSDLALSTTPIGLDMPPIGPRIGGMHMPPSHWSELHDTLGRALYTLLSGKDVINKVAIKSKAILIQHQFSGDGFQVIHDILRCHHPMLDESRAPTFITLRGNVPIMPTSLAARDQESELVTYFMNFTNWESHLALYYEARYMCGTDFHLLFVTGLSPTLRAHVTREHTDLKIFKAKYRSMDPEPEAPYELRAEGIYKRLLAAVDSEPTGMKKGANVSAIATLPSFDTIIQDEAPSQEQIVSWCTQIGDQTMTDAVVAAFQQHHRRQRPQAEKRPVGICPHLHCSKSHSPDDCCVCTNQRHPVAKCWHLVGIPMHKKVMVDSFKQQHASQDGPWKNNTVLFIDPIVSSIALSDVTRPPPIALPEQNESGVVLTTEQGELLAVQEMDEAYTSSFVRHFLKQDPVVSTINETSALVDLPNDGPEVSFVSRLNLMDTVVAHVDTGATVMVSNVKGELHGAIPTKARCGTAMTGSRANIDALGTWMVDLVGSTDGNDLPLAIRGTTQITEFQRRSLSLHALQELGFDCAHVLTKEGNYLDITAAGKKYSFPLITINGGDYVEMRIHRPPPANTAAISVARLDLVKNFHADGLYHLLHLRYGCPGRNQMEIILKNERARGVPSNVVIPEFFRCPICDKEKTNSLPRTEVTDHAFLPIGVRFHADYGFYKQTSIRGFTCFLLVTEAVTGYKWTFCRRSKHPPINLLMWFMKQLRLRLGLKFAVLRTDGGGELWGCHDLRKKLLSEGCAMEPTGAYNSAANGLAERGIGVLCVQTQICLYASGMDVMYWCFAMSHAAMLCNYRPRVASKISSHESLFKKVPNFSNLAIWGSPVYVVDRRVTRRRPESATITGKFLGYAGSHNIITYQNDTTGSIQYAHHTAIDELDLQKLPGDRSPAAKFLSGIIQDARHDLELRQAIADLTPTLSPWMNERLVYHHVPYDVTCNTLGIVTKSDERHDKLQLAGFIPGSPAERHLTDKNIIGYYLLAMNGVRIRSVKDIRHVLHDYHDPDPSRGPAYLTGITMLFGVATPQDTEPEQVEFSEQDHATARVVWSIIADESKPNDSVSNETLDTDSSTKSSSTHRVRVTGGGIDPRRAAWEMQAALQPPPEEETVEYIKSIIVASLHLATDMPMEEIRDFVRSIMMSDLHPTCPKFWHQAMKDPIHKGKWIEAMYKHLDSCYAIGTFGSPRIPPTSVTVLPAVIVLKMIVNAVKQINSHKVRVCVHGGHQVQGRDFDESFAHTILGRSIKICVAISCYLRWQIFHFDIHNAFQTCPDTSPESKRTWLKINQTWLDYFRERHPTKWPAVQALLDKNHRPEDFAVEMFMFVQGRTDASRKWGELVEGFIFTDLGLIPNRADPCTYSGFYNGQPVILNRATDDFLLFCNDKSTYDAMIAVFRTKWTVHALDEVKLFFGIRFICSDRCVTLDQTHKIKDIITDVFGPSAHKQPGGKGYSIPMIAGTEHANELAACTPYTPSELRAAQTTEYAFVFRHVLGGCMHCALWTRLDILPACLILAQYQAQPGHLHFKALKHLVGYLRHQPDIPLAFTRSSIQREVGSINFELLDTAVADQVNSLFIEIIPSCVDDSFESDPSSFSSCDNLFETFESLNDSPPSDYGISVARLAPPVTECFVDANLPGGIHERMATSGGSIEMTGTTVIHVSQKQTTMAESSTEAEMASAAFLARILRWLVLFMSDLGLPFQAPIPIAEDNAATRIIAHSGKLTRNVRHVAIKTLALQNLVRNQIAIFNAIGTALNRSDHFTKPLPFPSFRQHVTQMMGLRFITREHARLTLLRNKDDNKDG